MNGRMSPFVRCGVPSALLFCRHCWEATGPCARALRQRTEPLTRCAMGAQKKEIEEAFDILDTDGSGEMLCCWHALPAEAELGSRACAFCACLCVRACVGACA